jgi:hypothetical protein
MDSYTLWFRYLDERVRAVRKTSPIDPARKEVNGVFERAMVFMHKVVLSVQITDTLTHARARTRAPAELPS